MADNNGYILLHRCLVHKPIWSQSTPEQKAILITLLLTANHTEKEWYWKGNKFKALPGQFVTSLESIAKDAGVSIQNVRTALVKFKKLEFLTDESTKTGRLVTIVNWHLYQVELRKTNKDTNIDLTKTQQRSNKDLTPTKNDKNDKNDKKSLYVDEIGQVIDYLNQKTNSRFRISESNNRHIRARLSEGYTLLDMLAVIDKKTEEWLDTDYAKYLRPETLFGNKFQGYLNQKQANQLPRAFKTLLIGGDYIDI